MEDSIFSFLGNVYIHLKITISLVFLRNNNKYKLYIYKYVLINLQFKH